MKKSPLFYLSVFSVFLAIAVVVLGAYTRLMHAGLGCPDWPTCYGHLWVPTSQDEIHAANQAFADTPVETDKTWPEQIHRIFASTLGLVILIVFGLAVRAVKNNSSDTTWRGVVLLLALLVGGTVARIIVGDALDPYLLLLVAVYFANLVRLAVKNGSVEYEAPLKLAALLAGFVILQGLFGMWTVTLKLWPQVVTAHLLGGFATLSLLWLLIQRAGQYHWRFPAQSVAPLLRLRLLAAAALVMVIIQIALGGWTTSNYAALACADFPMCHNRWWPQTDFIQGFNIFQHVGPNYLGGLLDNDARTAIHLSHRIGALLTFLLVTVLTVRLWRVREFSARFMAIVTATVLVAQIALGISNVVFALPLAVAVAHNAVGALLLLTVITINHRIQTVQTV